VELESSGLDHLPVGWACTATIKPLIVDEVANDELTEMQ
jgi:hypothetical protein